jgi:hypothetical protein
MQNQGPKEEENKPIAEANHLNFAQNPHRPTLEDQRRTHNEIGLKVAHLGCGPGGAPRAQPSLVGSYRCPKGD